MRPEHRSSTVEVDPSPPSYRVRVWSRTSAGTGSVWSADEWEVTDSDSVYEVIEWVEDRVADAVIEILVRGSTGSYVRIFGSPPPGVDLGATMMSGGQ